MQIDLQHVTLTGIDEKTNLSKIWMLSKRFPMVEWGVLYSYERDKGPRYPRRNFILDLLEFADRFKIKLSLHLCGQSVFDLLNGNTALMELAHQFPRIQLNVNQQKKPIDLNDLFRFMLLRNKPVILQHNQNNAELTALVKSPNHHVLIDESLGRGQCIQNIAYIEGKSLCGWAGGIGADTLPDLFPKMVKSAAGRPFSFDMESSLRTNDLFDVEKAETILKIVQTLSIDLAQNKAWLKVS